MITIEMKACEKGFRMNPEIIYFPVFVVEILKVKIGEVMTINFEKTSRGPSQRSKRVWVGFCWFFIVTSKKFIFPDTLYIS